MNGFVVVNPTLEQTEKSTLDLVVAGTTEGVLMVESEAKELPEDIMLSAVMEGHRSFQPVIEAIIQLAEHAAKIALASAAVTKERRFIGCTATLRRRSWRSPAA